jgi:hypothetical protein
LVEQLDCKKSTSIYCDGFSYFRSEGAVEKCGSGLLSDQRNSCRVSIARLICAGSDDSGLLVITPVLNTDS